MLARLATFLHAHGRRVLLVAVLGAAIAGAFGFGVGKRLSPYGATDPATQSVQATNRFQAAAGRQIDAGVVALVSSGNVRSAAARARVTQVAAQLRVQPDVASVVSFYGTHNPAMVSRDGRSTYVLAYFKPLSDKALKDVAAQIESHFAGQRDVTLGGAAIANAQVNTQVSQDLAHAELLAFPFIFLLSLLFFRSPVAALLPPLIGGLSIVATFPLADQGGPRCRRLGLRGGRDRARAHRQDRDRRGAAVRGRNRRVRDLTDRVHQGARPRRGAGGADRRLDRPRAARALADGAAGIAQLVGAPASAQAPRARRAPRERPPGGHRAVVAGVAGGPPRGSAAATSTRQRARGS